DAAGEFASAFNAGSTASELGVQSHVGALISEASVFLQNYATVHGDLATAGTLTEQLGADVQGTRSEGAALGLLGLESFQVTIPTGGSDIYVPPDQDVQGNILNLAPGVYGRLDVHSRSTVALSPGAYFFRSVHIE